MDWRSQQGTAASPWLFPNREGGQLDNNAFNLSIARTYRTLLGVRLSSHSFRDTACHLAVAQGATVYEVQRFLGHKTAITTEHYLRKVQAQGLRLHALDREYMGVVA
jgi:integrase